MSRCLALVIPCSVIHLDLIDKYVVMTARVDGNDSDSRQRTKTCTLEDFDAELKWRDKAISHKQDLDRLNTAIKVLNITNISLVNDPNATLPAK